MARLDDIISGRSGYDCSAAASAKWSNGLGALSSSTFLVYKYIVRVCILCVCVCVCLCACVLTTTWRVYAIVRREIGQPIG